MSAAFDTRVLREFAEACSKPAIVARFVSESLRDLRVALDAMHAAGERDAPHEFADRAHALRGVAANIGARRLAEAGLAAMRVSPHAFAESWRPLAHEVGLALAQTETEAGPTLQGVLAARAD